MILQSKNPAILIAGFLLCNIPFFESYFQKKKNEKFERLDRKRFEDIMIYSLSGLSFNWGD
jgi:hypothetical protein